MKPGPKVRVFKVRIHARKNHGHDQVPQGLATRLLLIITGHGPSEETISGSSPATWSRSCLFCPLPPTTGNWQPTTALPLASMASAQSMPGARSVWAPGRPTTESELSKRGRGAWSDGAPLQLFCDHSGPIIRVGARQSGFEPRMPRIFTESDTRAADDHAGKRRRICPRR